MQDLMALGDFLTLPEDDLALASVLKSPLFGLDDDDLLVLAPRPQGHAVEGAARQHADNDPPTPRQPPTTLKQWREQADFTPPYEFLCRSARQGRHARQAARAPRP